MIRRSVSGSPIRSCASSESWSAILCKTDRARRECAPASLELRHSPQEKIDRVLLRRWEIWPLEGLTHGEHGHTPVTDDESKGGCGESRRRFRGGSVAALQRGRQSDICRRARGLRLHVRPCHGGPELLGCLDSRDPAGRRRHGAGRSFGASPRGRPRSSGICGARLTSATSLPFSGSSSAASSSVRA